MTPEEASASLAKADALLKSINDHVNSILNNVLINALPWAKDILRWIHDRVADISHQLESIAGHITGQISNAIGGLLPTAVDFLMGIANNIFADVHNILGNLATAEEFVGGAINELSRHAGKASEFILGAIGGGIAGGLIDVLKFLELQDSQTVDHMLDEIISKPAAPPWLQSMLKGIRGRGAEWQALVLPFIVGAMLRPIGDALLDPWLKTVAYGVNKASQTEIRSAPELVEARLKNIINDAEFNDQMALNNYNSGTAAQLLRARQQRMLPEEVARLHFRGEWDLPGAQQELSEIGIAPGRTALKIESLRPLLSPDEIRDTFRRGIIDEPKHDALLAQHGFTPDAIARKKTLYWLIPPPPDLIHMAIRNVFSPEIVERFKLFGDFPPTFEQAARQQGISKDWALRYWGAHWIVPSNTEGFEMFHRTTLASEDEHADTFTLSDGTRVQNVIGRSTLQLLLREKDTAPYYRNKLTEIAYNPLTRIDVRRMYSVGSLDHAGVERAYLDLGYSPTNARRLADFVKRYYDAQKKDRAQPLIDGLRRRILDLYVKDKLELSDASFALTDLNFTEQEAQLYLAEADLVKQAEDAQEIEAGVGRIFTKGFITEDEARTRLQNANVPKAGIDRLIRKWKLAIEYAQDTEHFHKVRDLTKTEALEAYQDKLMSRADAERFMEMLGYPQAESEMLIALSDFRAERASRTATMEAIKQLYVNGIREIQQTSSSLDSLHLPVAQRDALLAQWTLLRETRTERIPIATIRDMVKSQYLSEPEAFAHLKRHRYTDDDAQSLIAFWLQRPKKGGGIIGAFTRG